MKHIMQEEKTGADAASTDRPQWTFSVASQKRSVSTLKWGTSQRPRFVLLAIILTIQAIVISAVLYFNSTISIPERLFRSVDVNVLSAPASPPPASP